jgi:ankyrin repeat protein
MAYRLNEAIENGDYYELERLLIEEKVDPNDLNGSISPLKTIFQVHGKIEELELLLEYGADSNIIEGSGITIFTDIIFLILGRMADDGGIYLNEQADAMKPYIKLLLNYGAKMDISDRGHPTARRAINDWATDYSWDAAYLRANGMMVQPSESNLAITGKMNSIIQEIKEEDEEHETYTAKQRSSLAKTGLPRNIVESVISNLDTDVFDVLGEETLGNRYSQPAYESMQRYDKDETYDDYLGKKGLAEYANYFDTIRGGKRTKKKKRGGVGTPRGMDRIPYGQRDSQEVAQEFIKAVIRDDYDRIKELISIGGNINAKNINESTALMAATIIKQDPSMVKFLLENGANPNVNFQRYGNIPLINYMTINNVDTDIYTRKKIIELLIKYGAKPSYHFAKDRMRRDVSVGRRYGHSRPLNSKEERYLREREYRNKQHGEKKINFSKLMNSRLSYDSYQPDEANIIHNIGNMVDEEEDKKRDEEIRNELIAEYVDFYNKHGGN